MSDRRGARLCRLTGIRKLQRDAARLEAQAAAVILEEAVSSRELAGRDLAREAAELAVDQGPIEVSHFILTSECVRAARGSLVQTMEDERLASTRYDEEKGKVSAAHTRVRQMEILLESALKNEASSTRRADQSRADDLVLTKRARS